MKKSTREKEARNKKISVYRHGEIAFEKIEALPENVKNLKPKKRGTILTGSNNNPHIFSGGSLYRVNENTFVFGYFVAKDTVLKHVEHGEGNGKLKTAKLPNGVYRLRRFNEVINEELQPVVD